MSIQFFLTAYDPSDLPGGSLDPLGFDRGYLFLAEKILPNMTNVANCPRYFGLLCAGAMIPGVDVSLPLTIRKNIRQEAILRFERLWALSNVLVSQESGNGFENLSGLRGVTYAERQVAILKKKQLAQTELNFNLLSRQVPYGAIGMYATVAAGCMLFDRKTYDLTPALGEPLGMAFINETQLPASVKSAVKDGSSVDLELLSKWGRKAYLWNNPGPEEKKYIGEMLKGNEIRHRFSKLLSIEEPKEDESELFRLKRIASFIKDSQDNKDLWESIVAISEYESCYQHCQLALERLLFLCRNKCDAAGQVNLSEAAKDDVITQIRKDLPPKVGKFLLHLDQVGTTHFLSEKERLNDILQFLDNATAGCNNGQGLIEAVINRHTDVQHGKFDRGRRKMPWLQLRDGNLSLTLTRVGGLHAEVKRAEDITPHYYRVAAADNWIKAAGGHENWRN